MFGINQISWGQFVEFIVVVLILWYLSIVLIALIHKKADRKTLFEEDQFTPVLSEGLKPIAVYAKDYPSELIPIRLAEEILLPVSLYEETGMDDGYPIECFTNPNDPKLLKVLDNIQLQS
ncbi:MAG: hypothetical protein K0M50_03540 [Prolixibacteraceae bacterium]|nr:hypothetical protein [Prolixibacteraceae bacterium]